MRKRLAAWIDAFGNGLLRMATACFDAAYTLDPARLEEEDRIARETAQADVAPWLAGAVARLSGKADSPPPEPLEVTAVKWVERTNESVYLLPASALRHPIN